MPDWSRIGWSSSSVLVAVCLGATGCWLDGDEWALKRYEANLIANENSPDPAGPDLGLGECVEGLFDGTTDGVASALTDDLDPSCSSRAGLDAALAWRVPEEGCWVVSARGSAFDPVLYGLDGCGGERLFCAEDNAVIAALPEGPTLVVLDGASQDSGEWKLEAFPLIGVDLGTDTTASGDTSANETWEESGCTNDRIGAAEYLRFTPPQAGLWRFEVNASFDAVVSVHQPCDFASSLECANATTSGTESVRRQLGALEEVIVRVAGTWDDGASQPARGTWDLSITNE